jgi:hypothetical protein
MRPILTLGGNVNNFGKRPKDNYTKYQGFKPFAFRQVDYFIFYYMFIMKIDGLLGVANFDPGLLFEQLW